MSKIYAIFQRVENAKAALGRVKKESWNQADLTVIYPDEILSREDRNRFEFGDEHFLETPVQAKTSPWPALKPKEIEGIGKVKMASSFDFGSGVDDSEKVELKGFDKALVAGNLIKNKVVAIIEANDDILDKIKPILESEGAEISFEKS